MPVRHLPHADARQTTERLLDSLKHWHVADLTAAPTPLVPELRAINANRAVVEQAKGALMLRYGLDSHQAFAVLVRWARETHTPVHTIAHTLIHGICEGSPQTGRRQAPLLRWMENRLRHNEPDLAQPSGPAWAGTEH